MTLIELGFHKCAGRFSFLEGAKAVANKVAPGSASGGKSIGSFTGAKNVTQYQQVKRLSNVDTHKGRSLPDTKHSIANNLSEHGKVPYEAGKRFVDSRVSGPKASRSLRADSSEAVQKRRDASVQRGRIMAGSEGGRVPRAKPEDVQRATRKFGR